MFNGNKPIGSSEWYQLEFYVYSSTVGTVVSKGPALSAAGAKAVTELQVLPQRQSKGERLAGSRRSLTGVKGAPRTCRHLRFILRGRSV